MMTKSAAQRLLIASTLAAMSSEWGSMKVPSLPTPRSTHKVHQGEKEKARRIKQMNRIKARRA